MHKIAGAGATAQNTFTRGDPATGTPATEVTQEWLNTIQGELVNIVEVAGATLDPADDTQVIAAILGLIAANQPVLRTQATTAQAQAGADTSTDMSPKRVAEAIAALGTKGLGDGQAWQDVKASRAFGVTYINSTGRPIMVQVTGYSSLINGECTITVDGVNMANESPYTATTLVMGIAIVPNGSTYSATIPGSTSLQRWVELR